jgi:hypothetical protein
MSSKAFGSMRPLKPHLLQETGGLAAEIKDVRNDVDAAFVAAEARTGFPSLDWLDATTGAPTAAGGPLLLLGANLLQSQTCDTVTLGSGTAGVIFKAITPGDSNIRVEIVQGGGLIDSLFTANTKSWYAFTTTNFDTIVQAKTAGEAGDLITVKTMPDASAKAGVLEETTNHVILHYLPGTSQVSDMETLIGTSTIIEVKTAGTGATVLTAADVVTQTNLHDGGYGLLTVTLALAGSTATQVAAEINGEATCTGVIFAKVLSGGGGTVLVAPVTAMTGGVGQYDKNVVYISGVVALPTHMETPWTDTAVYATTPNLTTETPARAATDLVNIVIKTNGICTLPLTGVLA